MVQNKKSRLFFIVVAAALILKLSLFAFTSIHAPQGKMLVDSYEYLRLSNVLASKGSFIAENGTSFEIFRTPGYPFFLAIFHGLMKIPLDGVVLIQIAMTLLAAFIVYKTAMMVEPKIAFLSAVIVLFDPPIIIYSMTILSEALFLPLISLFLFFFVAYLKGKKTGHLILSAIFLAISAYVRPVSYYLIFVVPVFILYAGGREKFLKSLKQALIFLAVAYFIVGLWQVRNYYQCHNYIFCSSDGHNMSKIGLLKSYIRSEDPYTKGMAPLPYYISVSFRSLMSLMTRPGNFKWFHYKPLTVTGLVIGYPWMVFWLSGLVMGALRCRRNVYIQLMLLITLYFIAGSVVGQMFMVDPKLRVSMIPFIAIISAYGWVSLKQSAERGLKNG